MSRLQLGLLEQLFHCKAHLSACRKITAGFSTSSRIYDESRLWGKIATTQELHANAKGPVLDKNISEERREAMKRIQELKKTIRESEQNLTGLQRMKYHQREELDDKDIAMVQMRAIREAKQHSGKVQIEPSVVTHTVGEIRNENKFRFISSIANLLSAIALCVVLYGMYQAVQVKVDKQLAQHAEAGDKVAS